MLKTEHCVTGPPGTGKSHLAQAIGLAAIQQNYRVLYRETHTLLDEIAEATIDGSRKQHMELLATVPLLAGMFGRLAVRFEQRQLGFCTRFVHTRQASCLDQPGRDPVELVPGRTPLVPVPTGVGLFPGEVFYVPKRFVQRDANLVHWSPQPAGGHFAACEQPELFVEDVRRFARAQA